MFKFLKNHIKKVFFIFIVGFISRVLINHYTGVNVFVDFTHYISLIYYSLFSCFIVFFNEFVSYFQFSIFPSFQKIPLGPSDSLVFNVYLSKDVKVITVLAIEGNRDNQVSRNISTNKSRGATPIDFSLHGNNSREGILLTPIRPVVNKNLKPVFIPYSEGLRQSTSNHNLSPIPVMPNTPNLNNLSTPSLSTISEMNPVETLNFNVRYPLSNNMSNSNLTSIELVTPRTSFNTNDTNNATIGSTDNVLPYIDSRLDSVRRNEDFQLFHPRHLSTPEWQARRERIITNVENQLYNNANMDTINPVDIPFGIREVDISKNGVSGKLKLGFKYTGSKFSDYLSKLESIYIKYHDVSKRHFYWTIWESNRDKYGTYQEFKKSWDPNTKIWKEIVKEIKNDVRTEVENLIRVNDPFKHKPVSGRNNVQNILKNHRRR